MESILQRKYEKAIDKLIEISLMDWYEAHCDSPMTRGHGKANSL